MIVFNTVTVEQLEITPRVPGVSLKPKGLRQGIERDRGRA